MGETKRVEWMDEENSNERDVLCPSSCRISKTDLTILYIRTTTTLVHFTREVWWWYHMYIPWYGGTIVGPTTLKQIKIGHSEEKDDFYNYDSSAKELANC